ncbi:hypothetical protein C0J52_00685 [Blattella germanica]|nr:hypothetical protein C0J52_00685 [Blattella germanica]
MASGDEDEVSLQETGSRRTTRATRAVTAKRSRGRKKTSVTPRTTRSKRSTRTTQSAESEEVEDEEDDVQESQEVQEVEDQGSPEVDKEIDEDGDGDYETFSKIAEENATFENGVSEENHNSDEHEPEEEQDSFSEETVSAPSANTGVQARGESEDELENNMWDKTEDQSTFKVKQEIKEEDEDDSENETQYYVKKEVNVKVEKSDDKHEAPARKVKTERESQSEGEEPTSHDMSDKDVPELEDSPPPTISTILPSPIRSGLKLKTDLASTKTMEEGVCLSQEGSGVGLSQECSDEPDINQFTIVEETNMSDESADDCEKTSPVQEEDEPMEVTTSENVHNVRETLNQDDDAADINSENVEDMTVIDEVTEDGGQDETKSIGEKLAEAEQTTAGESGDKEGGFRTEPDTEMVSEDELPTESSKEPLETEAVSDEELPDPTAAVDLPETEAVSEDELPPEKTDKKKKKTTKQTDGSAGKKKARSSEAQKRKLADGDTYDPSSPTSENSCDESPAAKRTAVASASGGAQAKPVAKTRKSLPELEKYWKAVKEDPSDFTGWTYLLQYVDQENDIDAAREAYDAFLSHYPYCYGYWRKYADYEKRKGNKEKCEEVFERGLKAIPLSVDLWIHFLNYSKATYPDDEEHLRTQFEKAISAFRMVFLCIQVNFPSSSKVNSFCFRSDRLWESYIKWETEGKRLQHEHISSNPPQKVLSVDEFLTLRREVLQLLKQYDQPTTVADDAAPGEEVEAPPGEEPEEQPVVKTDEETTALRERIISIRRKVHKATVSAVADRWNYEEGIKRPYFHVKPLERCQLKNWKEYLDFEIEQGDQERIIILFERCLIACALYEEFWIKFIRYLESLKGDLTDKIRNVYERACTIHHTKKPNLHLHWAVFEESHKNYDKASEILNNLEKLVPNMLQVAYRRINLERRCSNMEKVCSLYEHYISNTKNKVISNNMAIKYARFCWKVKGDVERAISILNRAVEKDKDNPRLYLQLIDMGLQQNPLNEANIVSIIDQFLVRDTDPEQKVLFAQRKVEFLEDFGCDILSVQKAHDEFQRYLKQAKDRKKKSPDLDGKNIDGTSKKTKGLSDSSQMLSGHAQSHASPQTTHSSTGQQPPQPPSGSQPTAATTGAGQYPPPNYSQTGGYSQQPPAQGGYQGGQYPPAGPQQPPTPYNQPPYNQQYGQSSDPNYANYQNWGYSQTGYGGYNQGWGNYNYY